MVRETERVQPVQKRCAGVLKGTPNIARRTAINIGYLRISIRILVVTVYYRKGEVSCDVVRSLSLCL